jgi:steroid 5-alpha reductase family enzyme
MDIYLVNLLVVAGLMVVVWIASLALRDASIVDPVWGLAFVAIAWATLVQVGGPADAPVRATLLVALVTIWGVRLAVYLFWRKAGMDEDYRYVRMRERFGASFWWTSLFVVFLLQAGLAWLVSFPVQAGQVPVTPLGPLDGIGVALWVVGLAFETVGDIQLARFKADPANRGRVLDRGLWRYTRHPNYFGDFLVWWGLFAIAAAAGAWWTVFGPVLMSVLLLRVSGVALLERTIAERRPGYEAYVRRTSAFFPRPPRRD